MTQPSATVLYTDNGDGSAEFTVSFADDDHRFSAAVKGDSAIVEYEETLTWRGQIVAAEPDEEVFKALMVSNEMTEFLETYDLGKITREK